MSEIVKAGQRFSPPRDQRRRRAAPSWPHEPYKLELIGLKGGAGDAEATPTSRSAAAQLTMYDNLDAAHRRPGLDRPVPRPAPADAPSASRRSSSCAAPPPTGAAARRTRSCSASTAPRGRRKDDLKAYLDRLDEAERRDHRKLGAELDLFSFPDEIGSGLAVFHPKGGVIKREMEDYVRRRHIEEGFDYVGTPHITKAARCSTPPGTCRTTPTPCSRRWSWRTRRTTSRR